MKVKLIPMVSYRVESESGVHIGNFTKEDEWQGMVRLVAPMCQTLIVESPNLVEELIDSLGFSGQPKERIANVIKASPDAISKLSQNPQNGKSEHA